MNQRPRAEKREGRKQTVDGGDDGRRVSPTAAKLCPPNRVFPPFLPLPSLFSFVLLLLLCLRRFLWIRSDLSREHRNPSITSDLPSVCVCVKLNVSRAVA